ncbi:LacI family DNA-binding transcriptional regulator [Tropicibacter naphthalenivorans]|uniref:Gluconate utilization system GNT-I transcriptional repressor n=1 Tax=Tropicibacter naphthalenivorans TaxID=441103 RepID=A0A0P1GKN9_9RHOB|nr:LacI family DNA-binding transcriptional regulator [Tropicibacter naphthalenivorans]CUH82548.1 Gluconate utilization system GNT-I transcriptional repressor [Tropicibacter naphthalenivorans]SMD09822.1 transcriptional regulator, LacI family [Tropicibacter naphthalenivorans]
MTQTQPTMHDVAAKAGVSQMTVSRVMRGTGYISDRVRAKVMTAAAEIGYVHNRLAGGIATYDNPLVAVVVPTLGNRVFTEVLEGISAALDGQGIRPVFGVSDYDPENEARVVLDLLSWRPRGLILSGLEHSDALRQLVAKTGVRSVEVMDTDGDPIQTCVGFSQARAGHDMARHLLDKGYRRIAYIASQNSQDLRAAKRLHAFAETVTQAGAQIIAQRIAAEGSSMALGRRLTAEVMASDAPQAIYYSNDDLAAGGLMHCLANGLRVPQDVALAGFNGLSFLQALPQQITTTLSPRRQIGETAAQLLLSAEPAPDTHVDLGTQLVRGETT